MIDKKILGLKIKELRVAIGKSQEELGRFLGKSHAAVSDIERGITDVTVKDLATIAGYLGVAVEDLLQEAQKSFTGGFAPLVQYRDSKDMTKQEREKADAVSKSFIDYIKENKDDLK